MKKKASRGKNGRESKTRRGQPPPRDLAQVAARKRIHWRERHGLAAPPSSIAAVP